LRNRTARRTEASEIIALANHHAIDRSIRPIFPSSSAYSQTDILSDNLKLGAIGQQAPSNHAGNVVARRG
jgi:hypothetical protein